jgi:pyruvate formate lyase activating enzyme
MDRLMDDATPQAIARAAQAHGSKSVAFTYNDPVIFAEYAMDTADACHDLGIKTVAVTAGYMHLAPAREFYSKMDAANVDLKAFSDEFYVDLCGGHLRPVLDILAMIQRETDCWLEITTLLIPGKNDGDAELKALAAWVAQELGLDVPLHFSAFHPDWKLDEVPPTPLATLTRARRIAMEAGLRNVYTGNVHDKTGDATWCPNCGKAVIERDWYRILRYALDSQGHCQHCGTEIAGRFGTFDKPFGAQRIPVRLHAGA